MKRSAILVLTMLTGFSGLVYEVAWQKYLGILLGSHAGATAAVLAIFLGGLSLGYWLFGGITRFVVARAEAAGRPPRLLLLYGSVEATIGLYVISFPFLFGGVMAVSHAISQGTAGLGFAIDVILATLLIGPASVLMGATIPVLTQALARDLDDATRIHAFVYAFNSVGAFAGALMAGFYLVPTLGLVGVMYAMGVINLLAGSVFIAISLSHGEEDTRSMREPEGESTVLSGFAAYAVVSLLVGYAMMSLQTTVIRIAGLSFGSSEFTFSMVVAVFVLCIAIGSFTVSAMSRIPRMLIVLNLWVLVTYLLLLYFQLPKAPYFVHVIRAMLRDSDQSFALYHFLGFLLLLIAIGLPVMLSGAMLPLLFHHLRREVDHLGDLAGNLYSWNTVGSLLGALVGGYALFFFINLDGVYLVALATLVIAAALLTTQLYRVRPLTLAAVVPVILGFSLLPTWEPELLTSGLFRGRQALPQTFDGLDALRAAEPGIFGLPVLFHDDDPMVTITVRRTTTSTGRDSLSIVSNGKSDGSTVGDYSTMGMLAQLPVLMADEAKSAFVIGWGTGVTVGELASIDSMEKIVVAEISRAVMEAAPLFDGANRRARHNPIVSIVQSDAYRALLRAEENFDIIISEPSNPWVSGVEKLYTVEFLNAAKARLNPGGVYAQWIHIYETDQATLMLVLRAYATVFDEVSAWKSHTGDMILLGFMKPGAGRDHYRIVDRALRPDIQAALRRSGISGPASLLTHELLPVGVVHEIVPPGKMHSLLHPILSDTAGRAFYRGGRAELPFSGAGEPGRLGRENSLLAGYAWRQGGQIPDEERSVAILEGCGRLGARCVTLLAQWASEDPESPVYQRTFEHVLAANPMIEASEVDALVELFVPTRGAEALPTTVTSGIAATTRYAKYYHHAAPFDPNALVAIWGRCQDSGHQVSNETCAEGFELAVNLMRRSEIE